MSSVFGVGYSVGGVPEPAAWLLMSAGVALRLGARLPRLGDAA